MAATSATFLINLIVPCLLLQNRLAVESLCSTGAGLDQQAVFGGLARRRRSVGFDVHAGLARRQRHRLLSVPQGDGLGCPDAAAAPDLPSPGTSARMLPCGRNPGRCS